ncbi:MAG: tyrosine-protein phosphatase [Planctomycetota bacterium]
MPSATSSETTPDLDSGTHTTPASRGWSWARFSRNAVLMAALIAAAVVVWETSAEPNLVPKNFGTVVEGRLFRSGELTPMATRTVVEQHGIDLIIDLGAHELGSTEERRAQATADALGVERLRIPLFGDATGDPNRYAEVLKIIESSTDRTVLVHCAAGTQRTGCLVGLYRSIYENAPTADVLAEAESFRWDPNDEGSRLRESFERWRDPIAGALETGEPIPYDGPTRPR